MTKAEHLIGRAMELIDKDYETFSEDKHLQSLSNKVGIDIETIFEIAQYIKFSYTPYVVGKIYNNLEDAYGYSLDDSIVEKCLSDFSEGNKDD